MGKKIVSILIIDDHPMVRDGIRYMLESQSYRYKFKIEEAATGSEGIEKAQTGKYEIIMLDYQLPDMNGDVAAAEILRYNGNAKILAVSNYDEPAYIRSMVRTGAKGYVIKNIGPEELVKAIESLLKGLNYFSNEASAKLIKVKTSASVPLTTREKQILSLIVNEYTNEEIANQLLVTKVAVDKCRQRLIEKLEVKNTAGLVKKAIEMNLTD